MKIEKQTLEILDILVNKINNNFDNDEDIITNNLENLYEYISKEDFIEFLNIINKVKKGNVARAIKISSATKENIKKNIYIYQEKLTKSRYSYDEIYNIFSTFDNENINSKFKLVDLKDMYFCLFSEKPSKNKSKRDIINALRNHFYSSNRANAFKL